MSHKHHRQTSHSREPGVAVAVEVLEERLDGLVVRVAHVHDLKAEQPERAFQAHRVNV